MTLLILAFNFHIKKEEFVKTDEENFQNMLLKKRSRRELRIYFNGRWQPSEFDSPRQHSSILVPHLVHCP